jgi:hypothetical protein
MVATVPDPSVEMSPGLVFTVQFEYEGKPLSETLPVDDVHVGWTILSITGGSGLEITLSR